MNRSCISTIILLCVVAVSGGVLVSSKVTADTASVDNISITVPISCTLSGTNTNHAATINNGTYQSDIGLSTIKAFCNDTEGFAIYAIGYTNEEDGNTVLTSETTNISTGTLTSGNNSQWAMKLATSSGATYPLTLGSDTNGSYANYHVIPSTYTKVAYRNSGTDIGQSAIGATMTSTYQVYISPTQAAGTYVGKVKYLLIHPASKVPPVGEGTFVTIDYWGNGKEYGNGDEKNTVMYEVICDAQGENCHFKAVWGQYREPENFDKWMVSFSGSQLEFSSESEIIATLDTILAGGGVNLSSGNNTVAFVAKNKDVLTLVAYGNEREGVVFSDGSVTNVYSVDKVCGYSDEENPCNDMDDMFEIVNGNYEEPGGGFSGWEVYLNNNTMPISNSNDLYFLMYFAVESYGWENTVGQIVDMQALVSPGSVIYDGNGATLGAMSSEEISGIPGEFFLRTPNYKKSGYGFAGWSEDANATPNGSSTIYGPNELVQVSDLHFQNKSTTLYAVWVASAGDLQNWNGCSTLSSGDVTALTDTRDGNTYTVAKLSDGKCWMIENLRLDDTATLSSLDTNNPALPLINVYGSSTSNHLSSSTEPSNWCFGSEASCTDQSMFYDGNLRALSNSTTNIKDEAYGIGGYYNWYSATAGNGTYSAYNTGSGGVTGSICPSGWELPASSYAFSDSDSWSFESGTSYPNNRIVGYHDSSSRNYLTQKGGDIYSYISSSVYGWMDGWMWSAGNASVGLESPGVIRCITGS